MARITLVTGGGRSGKSSYALKMADAYEHKVFVATAVALDDEMRERIEKHRRERDASYHTVEEPTDLAAAIRSVPPGTQVTVVDCLTVWLGNLMHKHGEEADVYPETDAFLSLLPDPPCDLILVTNELGMGIIPGNAMARRFRDIAGRLNQNIADRADRVVLMVCGIPVKVKGELE